MSRALAITTAFTALATIAVSLRLFTRFRMVRTAGWDDGMSFVSLMATWVFFAFAVMEVHYGLGKSQSTLTVSQITRQLKSLYFTIIFYNFSLTCTKISMLLLYLRLFPTTRYRIIVITSLVVIPILGLWMILSSVLFCIPVADFWSPRSLDRCLPRTPVWFLNAALQIVTDLWIVILPMPMWAVLRLPWRQKTAVVVLFGLGIFVCVMSIVRLAALASLVRHQDVTRYNDGAAIWSSIEANVAIICSCLPPLRPLITRIIPASIRGSSDTSHREKPSAHPFIANTNPIPDTNYDSLRFGSMSGGYLPSVTASLSGVSTQGRSRETSRARAKSLDLGEGEEEKDSPGGMEGEAEPDEDRIQVARELRLDSDSRLEQAEL